MTEQEIELTDACLDNLDYSRIHTCMTALDWRWRDIEGVPTMFDLKQASRKLLKDAIKNSSREAAQYNTATGGFHVSVFRESGFVVFVEVKFCVAESSWDVDYSLDFLGEI